MKTSKGIIMKKVICPNCGNRKRFLEWMIIHRYNYFIQQEDGKVLRDMVKDTSDDETDSVITCEVCGKKLEDELYHQLLDNYGETIFEPS